MENNFTIHIFGYGEVQYSSKNINFKTLKTDLTNAQPLLDAIWAAKPDDAVGGNDYHTVNLFGYKRKKWMGKGGRKAKDNATFSIIGENSLVDLIDALISEIKTLIPEE